MVRSSGLTAVEITKFLFDLPEFNRGHNNIPFFHTCLLADSAEGDAAQQVIPQRECNDRHGDQEAQASGSNCRPFQAAAPKHGGDTGRSSAGFLAGEHERKGVLIPGKDQAKDRRCGDTVHCLGQDDLEEGLQAGIAVHQGQPLHTRPGSRQ